jgi:hypothetical protein
MNTTTVPTSLRALRDLAALVAASLAVASVWAAGLPLEAAALAAAEAAPQTRWVPRLDVDYERALAGAPFSLRVENVAKGMQYAIGYGGQTYTYVLGPFDAAGTSVRAVADLDGDARPDFLVDVDAASYLLLSTRAEPGFNLPSVELAAH